MCNFKINVPLEPGKMRTDIWNQIKCTKFEERNFLTNQIKGVGNSHIHLCKSMQHRTVHLFISSPKNHLSIIKEGKKKKRKSFTFTKHYFAAHFIYLTHEEISNYLASVSNWVINRLHLLVQLCKLFDIFVFHIVIDSCPLSNWAAVQYSFSCEWTTSLMKRKRETEMAFWQIKLALYPPSLGEVTEKKRDFN